MDVNAVWWRLAALAARLLEPAERDAALGDLVEAGETGAAALRGVLGLAARRQAEAWRGWRPWFALVALTAPFAMLLSLVVRRMADFSALYLWLYVNNWNPIFVRSAAFRGGLLHLAAGLFLSFLMLACWSWTAGFALGLISRRAIALNGALFLLLAVWIQFAGAPRLPGMPPVFSRARDYGPNAAVFAGAFYRSVFPLLMLISLALLPAIWGMRHTSRLPALPRLRRIVLSTAALATAGAAGLQMRIWDLRTFGFPPPQLGRGWPVPLLRIAACCWPAAYLAASAIARRRAVLIKENHT